MNLSDILEKHFSAGQRRALKRLLLEFELYQPLSDISEGFSAYKTSGDRNMAIKHFGQQSDAFVTLVSWWLIQQEGNADAAKNRDAVGCLLVCMAIEALQHYQLKPAEVFSVVYKWVMADAYLKAHHMDAFHNFIGRVHEKWLALPAADKPAAGLGYQGCNTYFIWQVWAGDKENHIMLDIFIRDLYHHWHRKISLSDIRRLFAESGEPCKIMVPSKYLLEFLTVFYFLHHCKRIVCRNNKGMFVFFKNHLEAPTGDIYPCWQDFSHMLHKELNHTVRGNTLRNKVKTLVDKYGTKGVSG